MNLLKEVTRADERTLSRPEIPADEDLFHGAEVNTPIWDINRARLSADRTIARCREKLPALASVDCALSRLTDRHCETDDYQLLRGVAAKKGGRK